MNILIVNLLSGNPKEHTIDLITKEYKNTNKDSKLEIIDLDSSKIKDCIGCWSCWVKTPGVCVHKDEMVEFYKKYMSSDKAVFLFETSTGFLSGSTKAFIDRLIPLYHPYIEIHSDELMHKYRYDKYPSLDFYYDNSQLTEEENTVVEDYCYRVAYHFRVEAKRVEIRDNMINIKSMEHREPKAEFLSKERINENNGKIILYNGSPRGIKGNSLIIIKEIIKGLKAEGVSDGEYEIRNLVDQKSHKTWAEDFKNHSKHFFVFPLYVHGMPSIVMKFFEMLPPVKKDSVQMTFLVQSGFIESYQSHYLRPYLSLLARRLGVLYNGTIIKGGIEGIQIRPEKANEKLFNNFKEIGREYAANSIISEGLIKKMAEPVRLKKPIIVILNALAFFGITNFMWNRQLKENKAFEIRANKPYV